MSTNTRKKGLKGVRTWLVLDSTGQTHVLEAGKHSIMGRTGLPGRDLRVLDPFLSYPSTVLGRHRAIVVNLEHVKAIVMAKEVLLLNSMDPFVTPFVEELQRRIITYHQASKMQEDNVETNEPKSPQDMKGCSSHEEYGDTTMNKAEAKHALTNQAGSQVLPFEFIALEACLEAACSSLENEAKGLELEAYPALDTLTSRISTFNLERVRQIKSRLVAITGRVQKVRDELERLLDNDDDMDEMYLSDKLLQQHLEDSLNSSNADEDDNIDAEATELDDRIVPPEANNTEIHQRNSVSTENGIQNEGSALDGVHSAPNSVTSESHIGSSRRSNPAKHKAGELEMLLEAYFVQIDGNLNKLSTLREYVDDTEDFINIILDDKQNQLLQMGVQITTANLFSTVFLVITNVLSMNVRIPIYLTDVSVGMPKWVMTNSIGIVGIIILHILTIAWYKRKRYID